MRPIEKGVSPYGSISKYQDAKGYLVQRIGDYCSYCEMQLDSSLAVEHIQPKSLHPEKECEWENLLLACSICNSTKGDADINDNNINDYLWPNVHNTFLALQYSEGGVVSVNPMLPPDIREKAQKLISLVGLDRTPDIFSGYSDGRWQKRKEVWDKAQRAKTRLLDCDCEGMRAQIVETAKADGYFSIWMTVFADDADIKNRLIGQFTGTACLAFDAQGNPIPRASQDV